MPSLLQILADRHIVSIEAYYRQVTYQTGSDFLEVTNTFVG